MLLFTPHKAAYHYDHGQVKKGLQGLIKKAGDEGSGHIYFNRAEHVIYKRV